MLLDARQFEPLFSVHGAVERKAGRRSKVRYMGNGIVLDLTDVRTFGGVSRFYLNPKGRATSTGSTMQPVRMRDPFRLPEMSAFKFMWNLELKKPLPKGVAAYIVPTPDMAAAGLVFPFQLVNSKGVLWSTALVLRRLEIASAFPTGLLLFTPEQILEDMNGIKEEDDGDSASDSEQSE